MKEAVLRRWAHAPWHSWLKEQPQWVEVFAEFWARLPDTAVNEILSPQRNLVVLPPVHCGRVVRIQQSLLGGAHILQLDIRLLERPRDETLGILAHEMAHLCTEVSADELDNDLKADQLAITWGFRNEIVKALKKDVAQDHPRLSAALAA